MNVRRTFAAFATLGLCALALPAQAQVSGVHLTISPYAGAAFWDDTTYLDDSLIFGGRAGLGLCAWFGIEGTYGFAPGITAPGSEPDAHHIGADGVITLLPWSPVAPYLVGGWSQLALDPDPVKAPTPQHGKQTFNGWEGGAGLKIRLVERLALRLEARDVMVKRDAPNSTDLTHNVLVTGGFHLALGGSVKDTDGDGVGDRKDRCPDTPMGAVVAADGCPTDADGDGVFDGLDTCANTPKGARVDTKGCPTDADGDGVFDGIDTCANTPKGARVDGKGCPSDADSDGVYDGLDRCDNTPAGAKVNPDGCPLDSDRDGIYDGIDLCANTPEGVRVDKNGCPIEVSEKETQLLDTGMIRLSNVNFDTGKTTLKPESFAVLDEVGDILVQWPQLQIEIGGHTDSRGSEKMNQTLSDGRAQAVLDYMKSKFPNLGAEQFTARGYGESLPISDNKTELGRAKNRRVEFKVLNTEVLKKEVEKRKLLRN